MPSNTRRAALISAVIFLAFLVFYVRGPKRALSDSSDFATVYAATRCWMFHANPYLQSDVVRQYLLGGGDAEHVPNPYNGTSVYPPSIFPLAAVVSWADWKRAKQLWLAINFLSFLASLVCVSRSEFIPNVKVRTALIALLLLCSPVPSGIAKGQPSVVCISLLVCAFYLKRTPRNLLLAGVLLGVSCCIKPNITLPFILFCCWRREWRTAAVSAGVVAIVSLAAAASLQAFSPGWPLTLSGNLKSAFASGGSMDPTIADGISYLLINLQTLIGFFTVNQALCNAVTYSLLGALAIWVIAAARRIADSWSLLALLALLVLLGSYHRYYDLQLLMLGTNAVLELRDKQWHPYLWATLVIPAILLALPLQAWAGYYILPYALDHPLPAFKIAWQLLLFRNQPICLLLLTASFAWAILRKPPAQKLASFESHP